MIPDQTGDERTTVVPVVGAIAFDREAEVVGHDAEGLGGEGGAEEVEERKEEIAH